MMTTRMRRNQTRSAGWSIGQRCHLRSRREQWTRVQVQVQALQTQLQLAL